MPFAVKIITFKTLTPRSTDPSTLFSGRRLQAELTTLRDCPILIPTQITPNVFYDLFPFRSTFALLPMKIFLPSDDIGDQHPTHCMHARRFLCLVSCFLPRDASAERGYEIAFVCPSVCPSVCDVQVSATHRLQFFESNFTAE